MGFANTINNHSDMIRAEAALNQIQGLVHFTPACNVPQILEHGLLSRIELANRNLTATFTDSLRLDRQLNATSLSISFPNYRMFFNKRKHLKDLDWAVIIIDPSILWEQYCDFYTVNAASADHRILAGSLNSAEALRNMFKRSVNSNPKLPLNFTTNPQAEVMTHAPVDPAHFHSVLFENPYVLQKTRLQVPVRCHSVPFMVKDALFQPRLDYNNWR